MKEKSHSHGRKRGGFKPQKQHGQHGGQGGRGGHGGPGGWHKRDEKPRLLPRAAGMGKVKPIRPMPTEEEEQGGWPDSWREKPSPALLSEILSACGFPMDELQINQLWQYHLRLKARNDEINLTRIRSFPAIAVKHFVDCLMVGKLCKLPSPLLDIGSGPGFPGVPLKIAHPDVDIILAEGRRARVEFLEEVRRCLRLPRLFIHGHQIHPSYAEPVRGVITRAVEVIPETLARAENCLCQGGLAIFMKGPSVDPEIAEVAKRFPGRFKLVADHNYLLPSTDHQRRLVIFERINGPHFPETAQPQ